jgi:hypothetical protein
MWGRRRAKYGNVKVPTAEGNFDSRGELGRWRELQVLQHAGAISGLKRQVHIPLKVNRRHLGHVVPDFMYVEGGRQVVEDFKSPATVKLPAFRLKWGLLGALHPEWELRISERRVR